MKRFSCFFTVFIFAPKKMEFDYVNLNNIQKINSSGSVAVVGFCQLNDQLNKKNDSKKNFFEKSSIQDLNFNFDKYKSSNNVNLSVDSLTDSHKISDDDNNVKYETKKTKTLEINNNNNEHSSIQAKNLSNDNSSDNSLTDSPKSSDYDNNENSNDLSALSEDNGTCSFFYLPEFEEQKSIYVENEKDPDLVKKLQLELSFNSLDGSFSDFEGKTENNSFSSETELKNKFKQSFSSLDGSFSDFEGEFSSDEDVDSYVSLASTVGSLSHEDLFLEKNYNKKENDFIKTETDLIKNSIKIITEDPMKEMIKSMKEIILDSNPCFLLKIFYEDSVSPRSIVMKKMKNRVKNIKQNQ